MAIGIENKKMTVEVNALIKKVECIQSFIKLKQTIEKAILKILKIFHKVKNIALARNISLKGNVYGIRKQPYIITKNYETP